MKKCGVYYELHHIIPRSVRSDLANLSKHPDNGVLLTAKEHVLVHRLLCKFTTGEVQISCMRAFHAMCSMTNGGRNKRTPSIGTLGAARKAASEASTGINVGIKGPPEWSNCGSLEDWEMKLHRHVDDGMSDPNIGKIYGVSAAAIHMWRGKLDICKRRSKIRDGEWLRTQYVDRQRSCEEIAQEVGCSGTAIRQKLIKFNIPIRTASQRQILANPKRIDTFINVNNRIRK